LISLDVVPVHPDQAADDRSAQRQRSAKAHEEDWDELNRPRSSVRHLQPNRECEASSPSQVVGSRKFF
jgi:hypothetical protein